MTQAAASEVGKATASATSRAVPNLPNGMRAVVTRPPLRPDGLRVTVPRDEPRVLVVPLGHRLAGGESASLDDIADEPLPRVADPDRHAFWRVGPRPGGRPAPDGPLVDTVGDKAELVAAGPAVAIVPAGEHIGRMRPGLTAVPLTGVAPSQVVLASPGPTITTVWWRSSGHSPRVETRSIGTHRAGIARTTVDTIDVRCLSGGRGRRRGPCRGRSSTC
ncbi:hypothetical protein SUDANB145_06957 [Streptomyces sp. enrichment culture]|uniref:LysR substrate-binding domain-containing protein n=1 Tax=Streptomyces sp. enrichment culture TaxID=1795815 RepID=UPI003F57432C